MNLVGKSAPLFEAQSTQGNIRLSDYLGRNIVLIFYPVDNTPG
jgi:thioredoxin-dependent peroxiredoxin